MNDNNLSSAKAKVKSFAIKMSSSKGKIRDFVEKIPLLITLEEAGILLSLDPRTIRRLSQKGILPPLIKLGHSIRISYPALMEYIQGRNWREAKA